jgi:hypothetical protein
VRTVQSDVVPPAAGKGAQSVLASSKWIVLPKPSLKHHWGTRSHVDYADDVFGRRYRPIPSIGHHWGTRNHRDFADDVFGRSYRPDSSIPHHWGTRTHGDYADDVFKAYRPDPAWRSHYGTHEHKDYADDVYGSKYRADPAFPYHWGTRKHNDYADDVFSRPFVSWDMPYGVAAPRAGDFAQDISPSEDKQKVLKDGAEDKSKSWYGWKGVQETGPGGTFKAWWPPGNQQQDVTGKGGNAVPTVRGDEGPNNYRIPFKDYLQQYASEGAQGLAPVAHFDEMTPPQSWQGQPRQLASGSGHAGSSLAAQAAVAKPSLKERAKAHLLSKAAAHLLRAAFIKHEGAVGAGWGAAVGAAEAGAGSSSQVDIPGVGLVGGQARSEARESAGWQVRREGEQDRASGSRGRLPEGASTAAGATGAAALAGKVQSNAQRLVAELYNLQGQAQVRI